MMSDRKPWFCVVLRPQATEFYLLDSWVGLDLTLPSGLKCSTGAGGLHYNYLHSTSSQVFAGVEIDIYSFFDSVFEGRRAFRLFKHFPEAQLSVWRLILEDSSDVVVTDLFIIGDIYCCRDGSAALAFDISVLSDQDYRTVSAFVAAHTLTPS
jgi:hypothetical protein